MKKIFSAISSTRTTAILLLIFGISIAVATFIENDFGTDTARSLVYNAVWFDLLLALGVVNIIAVTVAARMYQRSKFTLLVFHLAFVVIIIGAAVTRFTGTEGAMYIREGKTADSFLTSNTYLSIVLARNGDTVYYSRPLLLSGIGRTRFRKKLSVDNKPVYFRLKNFSEKAEKILQADDTGVPHARIVLAGESGRRTLFIAQGDSFALGSSTARFLSSPRVHSDGKGVSFFIDQSGEFTFIAPYPVVRTKMVTGENDTLAPDEAHILRPLTLHSFDGAPLVLSNYLPRSRLVMKPVPNSKAQLPSLLEIEVNANGHPAIMTVTGMKGEKGNPARTAIDGTDISLSYGSVPGRLPFAIHLDDFILERYPGSGSPSWFESRVKLVDMERGIAEPRRIYMNNILNYKGYRLYQSSYDPDEHGSVLSVNHDGWGTLITYFGYLCLAAGFVLSLANRNSRFLKLWRSIPGPGRNTRVIAPLLVFSLVTLSSFSRDFPATKSPVESDPDHSIALSAINTLPFIDEGLAREFDSLLVQDVSGRIEPMNTLSSEILRKVVRKESYKGQTAAQIILGMLAFPGQWLNEPMIRVNHPAIEKTLGITGEYASFNDFFRGSDYSGYIFKSDVEEAYRKKPAYRTKYDNEIMRVDERLNICSMIYSQRALKIFPYSRDASHTWYSPVSARGVFRTADSVFASHVIDYLAMEIRKSETVNNWDVPVELVRTMKSYQKNNGSSVIPPGNRIRAEIIYNNANLFSLLMRIYLFTGFILLLFQFIHMFRPSFKLRLITNAAFIIIMVAFILHAGGLGLRWYVSGHAPWSNGYEALTFIAWATVLSGLVFSRKSGITLSATAILASLILMVARLSWMDPQITNLVPVLKSYWLVIHVAVITASYGFLGLGALLAMLNLLLMGLETKNNSYRLEPHINQVTAIIEMTLIVGLYMLTIGTFLGGVWANESWGRYWGWDPKETWALITAVVYAVILHLRLIPGLKGKVLFNILALAGFSSVIMTYFGVNYYLSGLHSYAKGDPMPVPPLIYYSLAAFIVLSAFAAFNQQRLKKQEIH